MILNTITIVQRMRNSLFIMSIVYKLIALRSISRLKLNLISFLKFRPRISKSHFSKYRFLSDDAISEPKIPNLSNCTVSPGLNFNKEFSNIQSDRT